LLVAALLAPGLLVPYFVLACLLTPGFHLSAAVVRDIFVPGTLVMLYGGARGNYLYFKKVTDGKSRLASLSNTLNKRNIMLALGVVVLWLFTYKIILNRPFYDADSMYAGTWSDHPNRCNYFQKISLWNGGPIIEHDFYVTPKDDEESCGQAFDRRFGKAR
jgi:hypothetical protein